MVVVIDYNVGNVKSVCNAFEHIGCPVRLSREKKEIERASGLVLPGVAAFGYAMQMLGDIAEFLVSTIRSGKPLLGICVGYQLLFEKSFEHGEHRGLGLISGQVVKLPDDETVPHMGWNRVELPDDMDIFSGLTPSKYFYFAHSYYSQIADDKAKVAYADYGFRLPAAVQKDNIYGTQFHPEKSGPQGLAVLRNFYKICQER